MTWYVRKEDFADNHVADADQMMRELFRAEAHLRDLDQNNIGAAGITALRALAGSASAQGITIAHDHSTGSPVLLSTTITGLTLTTDVRLWASATTFMTFELVATTRMRLYARGQYTNATTTPAIFDTRFLIDGEPGQQVFSGSLEDGAGGTVRMGWALGEERLMLPGAHSISLQGRDRSSAAAAAAGTASGMRIYALGAVR
jgi:hypothetical protein